MKDKIAFIAVGQAGGNIGQLFESGWNINPRSPVFWQWGYKDGNIFGKTVVTDSL